MIPIKDSYSFAEIIEAQSKNLDEKIEYAVSILQSAFKMSCHNVALAFSGGKDSTVVADLIERFLPEQHERTFCIFGNTGVEFPESLKFARKYGKAHFGQRFFETKLLRLEKPELRYDFAKRLISQLESEGALGEVLKPDGKLKGQNALICAAKKRGYELNKDNCFPAGKKMDFRYCLEQYGAPLLGKSASNCSNIGKTARIVNAVGNEKELFKYRPCAYDDFSEMVDLAGTGIDSEYDPEVTI